MTNNVAAAESSTAPIPRLWSISQRHYKKNSPKVLCLTVYTLCDVSVTPETPERDSPPAGGNPS
jgi:hypothetical protein